VPLWLATGAGAVSRQILGTVVVAGMIAATGLAIFLIPALFVVFERLAGAERKHARRAPAISAPGAPEESHT
jgi:HAE1 family hydrophobic/amphiphilic exporter-1